MLSGVRHRLRDILGPIIDRRVDLRLAGDIASAARFIPDDPGAPIHATRTATPIDAGAPGDFPLPPPELWEEAFDYLALGEQHVATLREAVAGAGGSIDGRILDFGCASGRLTRWFLDESQRAEVWGIDVNAAHIEWNQRHLSPPFHFTVCTTLAHLPFEDGYFGLVYAGSVFTHISEMEDPWLLELRRVTRPGGYLYLTIQDQNCADRLLAGGTEHWSRTMIDEHRDLLARLGSDYETIRIGRSGKDAMVFHDRDALVRRWSAHLEVVDVVDDAFYVQTAVVLRKRDG